MGVSLSSTSFTAILSISLENFLLPFGSFHLFSMPCATSAVLRLRLSTPFWEFPEIIKQKAREEARKLLSTPFWEFRAISIHTHHTGDCYEADLSTPFWEFP